MGRAETADPTGEAHRNSSARAGSDPRLDNPELLIASSSRAPLLPDFGSSLLLSSLLGLFCRELRYIHDRAFVRAFPDRLLLSGGLYSKLNPPIRGPEHLSPYGHLTPHGRCRAVEDVDMGPHCIVARIQ